MPCGVQRRLCAREVNRITLRWEWYSPLRESDRAATRYSLPWWTANRKQPAGCYLVLIIVT